MWAAASLLFGPTRWGGGFLPSLFDIMNFLEKKRKNKMNRDKKKRKSIPFPQFVVTIYLRDNNTSGLASGEQG